MELSYKGMFSKFADVLIKYVLLKD